MPEIDAQAAGILIENGVDVPTALAASIIKEPRPQQDHTATASRRLRSPHVNRSLAWRPDGMGGGLSYQLGAGISGGVVVRFEFSQRETRIRSAS